MKNRYGYEVQYSNEVPQSVVAHLERAAKYNYKIRVFYGDTERIDFERVHGHKADPGKDWNEENDVTGFIGVSGGVKPIILLIPTKQSHGGGSILVDSIVRLFVNGHQVYQHPNYHNKMDNAVIVPSDMSPAYSHNVEINGEVQARFHSEKSAIRWLKFMQGKRIAK